MSEEQTHFGFEQVPKSEKADRVADVFRKVAGQYDIMNDVMSLGSHRLNETDGGRDDPGKTWRYGA